MSGRLPNTIGMPTYYFSGNVIKGPSSVKSLMIFFEMIPFVDKPFSEGSLSDPVTGLSTFDLGGRVFPSVFFCIIVRH